MRLIDADALLKELESNKLQPTKDTDGFIDGWCEGFNTVVDMIRNQSTAFDKEQVIHNLECEKTIWVGKKITTTEVMKIDDAIDIVKKGGLRE